MPERVDGLVEGARLGQHGALQHGTDPYAAVRGRRLGVVLSRGTATNGAVMKVRSSTTAACCTCWNRWRIWSTPVTTSISSLMRAPGGGRPMLLGQARQGLLGQPQLVAALGDQCAERHGRRRDDVGLVIGAKGQARATSPPSASSTTGTGCPPPRPVRPASCRGCRAEPGRPAPPRARHRVTRASRTLPTPSSVARRVSTRARRPPPPPGRTPVPETSRELTAARRPG